MKGIVGQTSLVIGRLGGSPAAPRRPATVTRTTALQPWLVWGTSRARPGAVVSYVAPRRPR